MTYSDFVIIRQVRERIFFKENGHKCLQLSDEYTFFCFSWLILEISTSKYIVLDIYDFFTFSTKMFCHQKLGNKKYLVFFFLPHIFLPFPISFFMIFREGEGDWERPEGLVVIKQTVLFILNKSSTTILVWILLITDCLKLSMEFLFFYSIMQFSIYNTEHNYIVIR